jgi:hypothetical protein
VKDDPYSGRRERFQLIIYIYDSSIIGRIGDIKGDDMEILRGHAGLPDQKLEILLNIQERY